ncbi:Dephospho-CoA kinase [Indibacter alkaliphilus LW1]|uniref:Dephospho-CoA kinase n=1 Tax=Indibacter alkaliphilus (strain CCUG 57479 / KCTC 22604 / LW1) TaxID=1189612 RepID=S2DLW3_INDAL|nr:dephospho-CoA kinase [Indibacter alkaliphilus]EPA00075.1 Dephospho-CoA kinase [Indibacter alkaliphilus LW1]
MNKISPKLIGITGGIGSGKTTVSKIFSILGIPIYYADDRAKWLMANNLDLIQKIKENFGEESYTENGELNRKYLAEKVFSDPENTTIINALVHPAVGADFENWATSQNSPYILKEAALLFETGSYKQLDKIINVSAPLKLRISRVMARDPQRDEKQINAIIDKQMPDEEKNKKADFIIKNGENKLLIPQVLKIHQALSSQNQNLNG